MPVPSGMCIYTYTRYHIAAVVYLVDSNTSARLYIPGTTRISVAQNMRSTDKCQPKQRLLLY